MKKRIEPTIGNIERQIEASNNIDIDVSYNIYSTPKSNINTSDKYIKKPFIMKLTLILMSLYFMIFFSGMVMMSYQLFYADDIFLVKNLAFVILIYFFTFVIGHLIRESFMRSKIAYKSVPVLLLIFTTLSLLSNFGRDSASISGDYEIVAKMADLVFIFIHPMLSVLWFFSKHIQKYFNL